MSARVIPVASPVGDEPVRLDGIDDPRRGDQRRPTRNGAVSAATAFSGRGGGGTMPVEPRYVEEAPRATLT